MEIEKKTWDWNMVRLCVCVQRAYKTYFATTAEVCLLK